jgi:hypothetical protein
MSQSDLANEQENRPLQTAIGNGGRVFFILIKVVLVAVMVTVVSTVAPLSASAKSLEEQLAEIEEALPGGSYTKYSPALAVQSWEMAATVAYIQKPASCDTVQLIDTRVTAVQQKVVFTKGRKLKQGRWSEIWTFDKCGKKIRVRADFKADGRGTADGDFSLAQ